LVPHLKKKGGGGGGGQVLVSHLRVHVAGKKKGKEKKGGEGKGSNRALAAGVQASRRRNRQQKKKGKEKRAIAAADSGTFGALSAAAYRHKRKEKSKKGRRLVLGSPEYRHPPCTCIRLEKKGREGREYEAAVGLAAVGYYQPSCLGREKRGKREGRGRIKAPTK